MGSYLRVGGEYGTELLEGTLQIVRNMAHIDSGFISESEVEKF